MLCLVLSGLAAGCADYMKRRDGITASAGDAQNWNKTVQITDPWPPNVMNTTITGDGQRVSGVIKRYSSGSADAGSQDAADAATSLASPSGQ